MTDSVPALLAAAAVGALLAALITLVWARSRALADQRAHIAQLDALRAELGSLLRQEQESHRAAMSGMAATHGEALQQQRTEAKQALVDAQSQYERRLAEQSESALSVSVHPFVNTEAEKSLFSKQVKVEVGYKYQLFVQGLPCFEPHSVVVESTTHKEVNEQTIELLKGKAVEAAEAAVQIKGGGVAARVISIAKAAVRLAT